MPLDRQAWEGDLSRLASPDTGLRTKRRKCRGVAASEAGRTPADLPFPEAIP